MDYVPEVLEAYNNKLKSQLYGLLCEYERERDWESFLDSILISSLNLKRPNALKYAINKIEEENQGDENNDKKNKNKNKNKKINENKLNIY